MTHGWEPPQAWKRVRVIDAHAAGEPLRVIVGGFPEPAGESILDRRRYAQEHLDSLRTALMWEPRGHADMYGAVVVPPSLPEADLGVLFLHNEGYSTMCGHGIIGLVTVLIETELFPADSRRQVVMRIEAPAGLVTAEATVAEGRVTEVRFRNVPSFVLALDQQVEVEGLGSVSYDLAYGGAFYAFVSAAEVGVGLAPEDAHDLIAAGMSIKRAVAETATIEHPDHSDLGFLYGTIFIGESQQPGAHSRNVCVFAEGEVDRSPTGTGVSARAAIHHRRGELEVGRQIVIESILGTCFGVRVVEEARCGPYPAVVPEVSGQAFITGRNELLIDPEDPLADGFLIR